MTILIGKNQRSRLSKLGNRLVFISIYLLTISTAVIAQEEVAFLLLPSESTPIISFDKESALSLPFELVSNLMWFEAEVDGERGNFILDTGVPTIVLNEVGHSMDESGTTGIGAGGQETQLSEGGITSFQLAGIEQGEQATLGLDLSGLAQRSERELLGIMGYEQLREYELLINYQESAFYLLPARRNELHNNQDPVYSLNFEYLDHLPVIVLRQGNKRLHFAIDTGAGTNLIDPEVLESGLVASPTADLTIIRGLDGGKLERQNFLITGLESRQKVFSDQKFVSVPLDHLDNEEVHLDGILGQPFLQQFRLSIDFKRQRIHFWE